MKPVTKPFAGPSATLRDIAKALTLSHSTVSRALHNNPRISQEVRDQVKQMAKKMGYHPNPVATALGEMRAGAVKSSISGEIAWLNNWEDPQKLRSFKEFDLYWKGAFETAERSGYRLGEFFCGKDLSSKRFLQIMRARNIRGILIPPQTDQGLPPAWQELPWGEFCAIRFGYSTPSPAFHIVGSDHLANGLLATTTMLGRGYQRIGFVSREGVTARFSAGYLLAQLKVPPSNRLPLLLLPADQDPKSRKVLLSKWLKKEKPDAILTDQFLLPELLKEIGLRVPEDVGLAALSVLDGNISSGIDQNSEEIGRAAMEMLISLISHNQFGVPSICREILINGEWVEGSSLPGKSQVPPAKRKRPVECTL